MRAVVRDVARGRGGDDDQMCAVGGGYGDERIVARRVNRVRPRHQREAAQDSVKMRLIPRVCRSRFRSIA